VPTPTVHRDFHLLHLPGMQGEIGMDRWFVRSLRRAGIHRSRVYDWTPYRIALKNLRSRAGHRAAAEKLAASLTELHAAEPHRRIVLTGHSTGGMVILDTLGLLEAGLVEQAWLLAPAVSPKYNLIPALERVGRMTVLHSLGDWFLCGLGTLAFGTADGRHSPTAALTGFTGPGIDHPRLRQWPYRLQWLRYGHGSGHMGVLNGHFARHIIAPEVLSLES
jgi:hypothetical protein